MIQYKYCFNEIGIVLKVYISKQKKLFLCKLKMFTFVNRNYVKIEILGVCDYGI